MKCVWMLLRLFLMCTWTHIKKVARVQQDLVLFKLRQTSHESLNKHLDLSNQENLYLLIFIKCNFWSYKNFCHKLCILYIKYRLHHCSTSPSTEVKWDTIGPKFTFTYWLPSFSLLGLFIWIKITFN